MDSEKTKKTCKNCDYPMENCNKFCTNCGQKDLNKKLSIKDFFIEFFSNFYAFDSKVLTSLQYLILKPGKLAKEYVEGKRLKFVNPFKLLLSLAIIVGLLISLNNFINEFKLNSAPKIAKKEKKNTKPDSIKVNFIDKGIVINDDDSNDTLNKSDTLWINKKKNIFYFKNIVPKQKDIETLNFVNKLKFYFAYIDDHPKQTYKEFCELNNYKYSYLYQLIYEKIRLMNNEKFDDIILKFLKSNFPYLLFLCLNFFALVMNFFYYRSGHNFTEHLIFVFYLFCFYLLPVILYFIIQLFYQDKGFKSLFINLIVIYNWIYFYKSLKNFYLQNKVTFRIKFVILSFVMPMVLLFSLMIVFILSVLLS